jgi:hypothetical protein
MHVASLPNRALGTAWRVTLYIDSRYVFAAMNIQVGIYRDVTQISGCGW